MKRARSYCTIFSVLPSSQAVHSTSSFKKGPLQGNGQTIVCGITDYRRAAQGAVSDVSLFAPGRGQLAWHYTRAAQGAVSDVSLFAPGRGQLAWHYYRRAAQGAVSDVSLFAPCRGQLALALQTSCAGGS